MTKNRKLIVVAGVVAVLALGYPAAAWFFGRQIEATHAELDARVAAIPYLKLVKHDYERRLFSASETVTFELAPELFKLPVPPVPPVTNQTPGAAANTDQAPITPPPPGKRRRPIQITMQSEIEHGPLPGFNTFGAGSVRTVILFDEATQQKISAVFGGNPPVDIQTHYGILGRSGKSTLTSPAFKLSLPGKAAGSQITLSGEGLALAMEFTTDLERYSVKGDAPRFEVLNENGAKIVLTGFRMESAQQLIFKDEPLLYSGTQRFTLAELMVEPGQNGGPKVLMKGFDYDAAIPNAGEYIDLIAKIGVTDFLIGEQKFGPIHYDSSLRHLHARKFAALMRNARALYARPMPTNDTQKMEQLFAPLKKQALELAMDNPEFAIDRLSINTALGEASLAAKLKLTGATPRDFANPLALATKIDFGADLSLPTSLIAMLQAGKAENDANALERKQATEKVIATVVQQGFVTDEGGMLKTRIVFRGKQLLVNDKPLNPMAVVGAYAKSAPPSNIAAPAGQPAAPSPTNKLPPAPPAPSAPPAPLAPPAPPAPSAPQIKAPAAPLPTPAVVETRTTADAAVQEVPGPQAVKPRRSLSHRDARACLQYEDNKRVMVCAERFR